MKSRIRSATSSGFRAKGLGASPGTPQKPSPSDSRNPSPGEILEDPSFRAQLTRSMLDLEPSELDSMGEPTPEKLIRLTRRW